MKTASNAIVGYVIKNGSIGPTLEADKEPREARSKFET